MTSHRFWLHTATPVLVLVAYFLAVWKGPLAWQGIIGTEQGIVELGTAAGFVAAGVLALGLWARTRGAVPTLYRLFYLLFGLAAVWVALEEIDYGQHLLHWQTPDWFMKNNRQWEMNLHNLAENKPVCLLEVAASAFFPLTFVGLPLLAATRRGAYRPPHWSHYLLPRAELLTVVALAEAVLLVKPLLSVLAPGEAARIHFAGSFAGEVRELYWAGVVLLYAVVIRQRLRGQTAAAPVVQLAVPEEAAQQQRKAA